MTQFDPEEIYCIGKSTPDPAQCKLALELMPALDILVRFGPRGQPNVQVPLPYVVPQSRT